MSRESHSTLRLDLLSARIKERALQEGFDKVGIVPAEPLGDERGLLEEWLSRGFHGEMAWMARDAARRTDPRELLDGARSVVAV
ncbi:MAG: tRNA epoxyqueuosine(34) reductase QueG, partial [Pyrinomonadaceae bacterium]